MLTLTLALAVAPTSPSSNLRAATMMASSPVICIATIEATRRVGKQSVRPARLASTMGVASTVRVTAALMAHAMLSAHAAGLISGTYAERKAAKPVPG